eukprot:gene4886-6844_t
MVLFLFVELLMFILSTSTTLPLPQVSDRSKVPSFKVMDVLARASELESAGRSICHMEVGQPATGAPSKVVQAAQDALSADKLGYTNALGQDILRRAISNHYSKKYGVTIDYKRIVVTTGSSAGFLLSFIGCFNPDDIIAVCSSGYPCYRNIMIATGLEYLSISLDENFKLTGKSLTNEILSREEKGLKPIKGLILSSPSNPTGVMLSPNEMKDICTVCEENNILFISDEIYHGISYNSQKESTALEYSNSAIVINSFSKYYSMTGWRLGWMVVPDYMVDTMNRLSQNMYINAPTLSQIAACKAFDCTDELDENVRRYSTNRQIVLDTLNELGLLDGAASPDGAFYVYIDLHRHGVNDSPALCYRILEEAGVAITPGSDFEDPKSGLGTRRVRFSYSRDTEEVKE